MKGGNNIMMMYALIALIIIMFIAIIIGFAKSPLNGMANIVVVVIALFLLNYVLVQFTGQTLWGMIFE